MITEYITYIKESSNDKLIYHLTDNINKSLKVCDRFTIKQNEYNTDYEIRNYIVKVFIKINNKGGYINCFLYNSKSVARINIDENTYDKITNYILKIYIISLIKLISNQSIDTFLEIRELFPYTDKTVYDLIDEILTDYYFKKIFIDKLLMKEILPLNIYNHYKYIVDSKNFNLI